MSRIKKPIYGALELKRSYKLVVIFVTVALIVTAGFLIATFFLHPPYLRLNKLGQFDTGGAAVYVHIEDNIAYVVDNTDIRPGGLIILDVSNPNQPQELGSYYEDGIPRKVDVSGETAFFASQNLGLEILNISDPSNLSRIVVYSGSGDIYDVQVVGALAYVADWTNGLVILNISNPSLPLELSRFPIVGACIDLCVVENIAYVIDHRNDNTGIRVIDVTDVLHPIELGSFMPPGVDLWNPVVHGNYMYVGNHALGGGELKILDISDPTDIFEVGFYYDGGSIFAAEIHNEVAYVADAQFGLKILDVRNPLRPILAGHFYDGGSAVDVSVVNNIAFVADREDGLEIIEIPL